METIKLYNSANNKLIGQIQSTYLRKIKEIDKIIFEPKGVIAIIITWNFPFSRFVWQAIPNLLVGNTMILKYSEYVPLCSKWIYEVVQSILPENVYNVIYGDEEVGENLAKQDIDMICFTGSKNMGQKLYKIAAEKFIPILLECGGFAPGIVLEDADVDNIIESIYINKFTNTGQTCNGQKKIISIRNKIQRSL